MLMEGDGKGDN